MVGYIEGMKTQRKLIAGNWKMNGTKASALALMTELKEAPLGRVDICVCPPFLHLESVKAALPAGMALGGQDCAAHENGAFTGDVSANMLADIGAQYVILGHSERRQGHAETDAEVAQKAKAAHAAGLMTIICVGELEAERLAGQQNAIVIRQLQGSIPATATAKNIVIAYEPVWAIGTGKTATIDDIREMHGVIRKYLQEKLDNSDDIRILYGGSVKSENAVSILAVENVGGALVGGASLKADQFLAIASAS